MVRQIHILLTGCLFLAAAADSRFAGTWEGTENNLPSVELTLQENLGAIHGTISFYFQSRGDDGKWHLGEKFTVPLLSPKLEGTVLTFETIHHKSHNSPELGPNNHYRVEFVDAKEARLRIVNSEAQKKDPEPGFKLTRRE